jgi:hypothetical protein
MRSGKTTLAHVLSQLPGLTTWNEPNAMWATGHSCRDTDLADASDAKPWVKRHILRHTLRYQQEHGGNRIIMEGPFAAYKIPFLREVYPGIRIIHLYRDGRHIVRERLIIQRIHGQASVIFGASGARMVDRLLQTHWRDGLSLPLKALAALQRRISRERYWWGMRYPGWREDRSTMNPAQIAALQWTRAVELALAQEQSPPRDLLTVRSESIEADPRPQLERIVSFCHLQASEEELEKMVTIFRERLIAHVANVVDPPEFASALEVMRPLLQRLGYLPRSDGARSSEAASAIRSVAS